MEGSKGVDTSQPMWVRYSAEELDKKEMQRHLRMAREWVSRADAAKAYIIARGSPFDPAATPIISREYVWDVRPREKAEYDAMVNNIAWCFSLFKYIWVRGECVIDPYKLSFPVRAVMQIINRTKNSAMEGKYDPITAEEASMDIITLEWALRRFESPCTTNPFDRDSPLDSIETLQNLNRLADLTRTHLFLLKRLFSTPTFYLNEVVPWEYKQISASYPLLGSGSNCEGGRDMATLEGEASEKPPALVVPTEIWRIIFHQLETDEDMRSIVNLAHTCSHIRSSADELCTVRSRIHLRRCADDDAYKRIRSRCQMPAPTNGQSVEYRAGHQIIRYECVTDQRGILVTASSPELAVLASMERFMYPRAKVEVTDGCSKVEWWINSPSTAVAVRIWELDRRMHMFVEPKDTTCVGSYIDAYYYDEVWIPIPSALGRGNSGSDHAEPKIVAALALVKRLHGVLERLKWHHRRMFLGGRCFMEVK